MVGAQKLKVDIYHVDCQICKKEIGKTFHEESINGIIKDHWDHDCLANSKRRPVWAQPVYELDVDLDGEPQLGYEGPHT